MKGLLEKDLRLMLSRKQSILIFIVASLFVAFTMDGSFFPTTTSCSAGV